MPNRNSVKRPRARRFKSPQSNKKTNFVVEMFFNNLDVPEFRKNITILKLKLYTFMYYQVLIYVNISLDRHVDITCTYVYGYFAT